MMRSIDEGGRLEPYVRGIREANARMTSSTPFRVSTSPIAGQGGFATRPISAGEWIIEYAGERITEAEFQRRDPARAPGDVFHNVFFEVAPNVVIDAAVGGNDARFLNHSCAPNCETRVEEGTVNIYARRQIALGAELCFDYAYVREPHHTAAMLAAHPCRCGAANCRGTMFRAPSP
jgi:uncharacterized protein